MTERRFLLPGWLDQKGRTKMVTELVRKHSHRGLVTTGYVMDVYPDERGWIDLPDNIDDRHCVYYAYINTRRKNG